MRLTIITSDSAVYVDGECRSPLDLTQCNMPSNVHAVQWFDTKGWIEFNDDGDPFTAKEPNQDIIELPIWAQKCVDVWSQWTPQTTPALPDSEVVQ